MSIWGPGIIFNYMSVQLFWQSFVQFVCCCCFFFKCQFKIISLAKIDHVNLHCLLINQSISQADTVIWKAIKRDTNWSYYVNNYIITIYTNVITTLLIILCRIQVWNSFSITSWYDTARLFSRNLQFTGRWFLHAVRTHAWRHTRTCTLISCIRKRIFFMLGVKCHNTFYCFRK